MSRLQQATELASSLGLEAPYETTQCDLAMMGLVRRYTSQNRVSIPQQWAEFVPQVSQDLPEYQGIYYGVCDNGAEDCSFDYWTTIEATPSLLNHPQNPWIEYLWKGGDYIVFPHRGHVSMLVKTIDLLWNRWVPRCPYRIRRGASVERYLPEFDAKTGLGGMEFWIPISLCDDSFEK